MGQSALRADHLVYRGVEVHGERRAAVVAGGVLPSAEHGHAPRSAAAIRVRISASDIRQRCAPPRQLERTREPTVGASEDLARSVDCNRLPACRAPSSDLDPERLGDDFGARGVADPRDDVAALKFRADRCIDLEDRARARRWVLEAGLVRLQLGDRLTGLDDISFGDEPGGDRAGVDVFGDFECDRGRLRHRGSVPRTQPIDAPPSTSIVRPLK